MKYIYITLLSLILLSCSSEHETETQELIDWEEELFGVGLYGTHPDSLDEVWYSHSINQTSLGYIKRKEKPSSWLKTKGDTLYISNKIAFNTIHKIEDREKFRQVLHDSSEFLISYGIDSLIQLTKIKGDSIIPNKFYIRISPKELKDEFLYLSIRMSVASANVNFKLAAYKDSTYGIISCYKCDDKYEKGKINFLPRDQIFINNFINTLIKLKDDGKSTGIVCTLGYSHTMELIYDSLSYEYDNLCIVPVQPNILHEYFAFAVDTSQITSVDENYEDFNYLHSKYIKNDFRLFKKGNDIVGPKGPPVPDELPNHKSESREENPVEVPPIQLHDSVQ